MKMGMRRPPCIRNLEKFKKSGCPKQQWNGEEGCPAWIELSVATKENPNKREIKKQCLDRWLWDFNWAMLGLLEGNQQAIETFRNGMVQETKDGQVVPKPDPAVVSLLSLLNGLKNKQQIIFEARTREMIEHEQEE